MKPTRNLLENSTIRLFPNVHRFRALTACVGIACALGVAPAATAALLVYEGYNGYTSGSLISQNVNANAIGLSGAYSGTNFTANTTGLTFGNLQVSGGSAKSTTGDPATLSASIASGISATGTLYESYLVNVNRTSGNAYTSVGTDGHFREAAVLGGASGRSGISYSTSLTGADAGSSVMVPGTTYMVISKWTNVGSTLSSSNPGRAQFWVLTTDQFASFEAAGGTESWLTSASFGTGANDVYAGIKTPISLTTGGPYLFDQTQTVNLAVQFQFGVNTFDEIRYGTTLADVTPVPEPSILALMLPIGAFVAFGQSVRRSKSTQVTE